MRQGALALRKELPDVLANHADVLSLRMVHTIEELAAKRARLLAAGSLVGESDHGVSKSLYAQDPDGIEFEVMWAVPSATWDGRVGTDRLDLPAELARWAATPTLRESNC